MYFADVSGESFFTTYKSLLDSYLNNPTSEETKVFFEYVIKTAHQLAVNEIDAQHIDNTIYTLVTALVYHNKIDNRYYFQNIDVENIGVSQLKTLSGILSSLVAQDYEVA